MASPTPRPKKNHLISRKKFREFVESHPGYEDTLDPLKRFAKIIEDSSWKNFNDVRKSFGSADLVGKLIVFNVCGNKVRVAARIDFKVQMVFIRAVMTHTEYDAGGWRE